MDKPKTVFLQTPVSQECQATVTFDGIFDAVSLGRLVQLLSMMRDWKLDEERAAQKNLAQETSTKAKEDHEPAYFRSKE